MSIIEIFELLGKYSVMVSFIGYPIALALLAFLTVCFVKVCRCDCAARYDNR